MIFYAPTNAMLCFNSCYNIRLALTNAMLEVYQQQQRHFLPEQRSHYIYSPRELSRWVRGMYEALRLSTSIDQVSIVWYFEEGGVVL